MPQIIEDKIKKNKEFKNKVIKIQSLVRKRYWLMPYINQIKKLINKLFQRERKKFEHEPTLFGDNSPESIKLLETAFKQRQKK